MIDTNFEQITSSISPDPKVICMDDVYHFFCDDPVWLKAAAFQREQTDCMLEMKGIIGPNVRTINELNQVLHKIWHEIAFRYFEASSLTLYKEAAVMRFVTVTPRNVGFTGRMIVGGEHYYRIPGGMLTNLPAAPFLIDFSDVDEYMLSLEESRARFDAKQALQDHEKKAAALAIVEKIQEYIKAGEAEFLNSPLLLDALTFNLHQLYRRCSHFERRKYPEVIEWCKLVRAIPNLMKNPEVVSASDVWSFAISEPPKLVKLLESVGDS